MTNKEHLIERLWAHCPGNVDKRTVEVCFEIFNRYDWAVFCSQMGDYDHPEERDSAKKKLDEELEKFTHPFGYLESYPLMAVVEHIRTGLNYDCEETCKFYNSHFHTMSDEYKGD